MTSLLISKNPQSRTELEAFLPITAQTETPQEAMSYLEQHPELSVVLAEHPAELEGFQALINFINDRNNYIFSVAVVIITDEAAVEQDSRFLGGCVIDCILRPFHAALVQNRLRNAETLINSVSFSEFARMLKVLPASIYLKDAKGRYVFSSQTWHHLDTNGDPNWTIRGKTDLDIRKDKENAKLAVESDLEIIRTGKGTSYVIEENDGVQEYLQLIKEPLFTEDGRVRGIIALINNVTEQERLKQHLREQSIHDTLTGLYNRTYLDEYIEELRRDARYPVAVISADCDNLKIINDTYGHMEGDKYICLCVKLMQETLPKQCTIFRTGGDEFLAFLPQMTGDAVQKLITQMQQQAGHYSVRGVPLSVSFGYAQASGEAESIVQSIKRSDQDMYQDKKRKHDRGYHHA